VPDLWDFLRASNVALGKNELAWQIQRAMEPDHSQLPQARHSAPHPASPRTNSPVFFVGRQASEMEFGCMFDVLQNKGAVKNADIVDFRKFVTYKIMVFF